MVSAFGKLELQNYENYHHLQKHELFCYSCYFQDFFTELWGSAWKKKFLIIVAQSNFFWVLDVPTQDHILLWSFMKNAAL